MLYRLLASAAATAAIVVPSAAFVAETGRRCIPAPALAPRGAIRLTSAIATPETETERRTRRDGTSIPPDEGDVRGPVEWLVDDPLVSRESGEPFHILLLDETFARNERMTIEYAATSCSYVLGMPYDEAAELAAHAEAEGFSCLGTWGHDECVRLGRELGNRDLVCRVVPFCEGGDRSWQARNARDERGMKRAEDGGRWG